MRRKGRRRQLLTKKDVRKVKSGTFKLTKSEAELAILLRQHPNALVLNIEALRDFVIERLTAE